MRQMGVDTKQVDKQGLPDDAKRGVTRHLFQKEKCKNIQVKERVCNEINKISR